RPTMAQRLCPAKDRLAFTLPGLTRDELLGSVLLVATARSVLKGSLRDANPPITTPKPECDAIHRHRPTLDATLHHSPRAARAAGGALAAVRVDARSSTGFLHARAAHDRAVVKTHEPAVIAPELHVPIATVRACRVARRARAVAAARRRTFAASRERMRA